MEMGWVLGPSQELEPSQVKHCDFFNTHAWEGVHRWRSKSLSPSPGLGEGPKPHKTGETQLLTFRFSLTQQTLIQQTTPLLVWSGVEPKA